jgi:hypothetical protein
MGTRQILWFDPAYARNKVARSPRPCWQGEGPTLALAPGETVSWPFNLSHRVALFSPGEYRLSANFQIEGAAMASNAVELSVLSSHPRVVKIGYAHAGFSDSLVEAWTTEDSPPRLFLRRIEVGASVKQVQNFQLYVAERAILPTLSAPPNGDTSPTDCVAWVQGDALWASEALWDRPKGAPLRIPLPAPGALIGPLWADPEINAFDALVRCERPAGTDLLVVRIQDGMRIHRSLALTSAPPVWGQTFFTSERKRQALVLTETSHRLTLHRIALREHDLRAKPFALPEPLALMAVAAQMNQLDEIHGVVLGRPPRAPADTPLSFFRFSVRTDGDVEVENPEEWEGLAEKCTEHLQIVVDASGEPHALAHDGQVWTHVSPEESCTIEPPKTAQAALSPQLFFMSEGTIPVVLWHDPNGGIVGAPIGVEFPDFSGPEFARPPMVP